MTALHLGSTLTPVSDTTDKLAQLGLTVLLAAVTAEVEQTETPCGDRVQTE